MQHKCIDCKETTELIKFKKDNTTVYICARCLDAKNDKGNKNHNSYVIRGKDSKTYAHIGQI